MTIPNLPSLAPNGVIQNPGVGEIMGQGMSQLAQFLQQRQAMQQQQAYQQGQQQLEQRKQSGEEAYRQGLIEDAKSRIALEQQKATNEIAAQNATGNALKKLYGFTAGNAPPPPAIPAQPSAMGEPGTVPTGPPAASVAPPSVPSTSATPSTGPTYAPPVGPTPPPGQTALAAIYSTLHATQTPEQLVYGTVLSGLPSGVVGPFLEKNKASLDAAVQQEKDRRLVPQMQQWLGSSTAAGQMRPDQLEAWKAAMQADPVAASKSLNALITAKPEEVAVGHQAVDLGGRPISGTQVQEGVSKDFVDAQTSLTWGGKDPATLTPTQLQAIDKKMAQMRYERVQHEIDPMLKGMADVEVKNVGQTITQNQQFATDYTAVTNALSLMEGKKDSEFYSGKLAKGATQIAQFTSALFGSATPEQVTQTQMLIAALKSRVLPLVREQLGTGQRLNQMEVGLAQFSAGDLEEQTPSAVRDLLTVAKQVLEQRVAANNAKLQNPRYEKANPGFGKRMSTDLKSYVPPTAQSPAPTGGSAAMDAYKKAIGVPTGGDE